jgi:hypothetical protein
MPMMACAGLPLLMSVKDELEFVSFAGATTSAERRRRDAGMACAAEDVPSDIVDFVECCVRVWV